ncbi:hypothetical protein VPNG_08965 [Cytospora leucostoma]|uniref:Uncharacterized protein n=1 Tax=Cytospora leucostoma TaxID=1230097 RepID=A0A423VW15_9PEZI|nr:hypothetical protein VPNG_08965 [Cytospora leucostoma]
MRITLILTFLTGFCSAYSSAGAYERVWYYYAYLIDASLSGTGGLPSKIASGCAKVMGTGGKKCSFSEFVTFIEGKEKGTHYTMDVGDDPPDVEKAARACITAKATEAYNIKRIVDNVHDAGAVFKAVGNYLQGVIPAIDDDVLKAGVRNAVRAVHTLRVAGINSDIEKRLAELGIELHYRENVPVFDGAKDTVSVYSKADTLAYNEGFTEGEFDAVMKAWRTRQVQHAANIREANTASAKINTACTY